MRFLVILTIAGAALAAMPKQARPAPARNTYIAVPAIAVPSIGGSVTTWRTMGPVRILAQRDIPTNFQKTLNLAARKLMSNVTPEEWQRFNTRLGGLFSFGAAGVQVSGRGRDGTLVSLGRTDANGYLHNPPILPAYDRTFRDVVDYTLVINGFDVNLRVTFLQNNGIIIVTDMDDTQKQTNAFLHSTITRETLMKMYAPLDNSNQALFRLINKFRRQASVIYLTGMPFGLLPPTQEFLTSHSFPPGHLNMHPIQMNSEVFSIAKTVRYKTGFIERVMQRLPAVKWIFIGDSGQDDVMTYNYLYQKDSQTPFKTTQPCILIRKVPVSDGLTPSNVKYLETRNSDARFVQQFHSVPRNRWRVVTDAELPSIEFEAGPECWRGYVNPAPSTVPPAKTWTQRMQDYIPRRMPAVFRPKQPRS